MPRTTYLWNDITDAVVMEKDGAGNTTAVYQSDPVPFGRLRSMRRGGTTYNYHFDGRGNTTYLTDQTGRKTDAYTYDAFGTQRTATGSTENPYRYGGQHGYQYNSETDDNYVRARVYQPKRGRWWSKDPLRFVDGVNLYLYVANAPIDAIDLTGMLRVVSVREEPHPLESLDCPEVATITAISWDFQIDLKHPKTKRPGAPCDGFLVQKIATACKRSTCDSCPEPPKKEAKDFGFYEAWFFKEKDRMARVRIEAREKLRQFTDRSSVGIRNDRCGFKRSTGEIRFYCIDQTGDLRKLWKGTQQRPQIYGEGAGCRTSVSLPSIKDTPIPRFWANTQPMDGPAFRVFDVYYRCCPCLPDISIIAKPRLPARAIKPGGRQ